MDEKRYLGIDWGEVRIGLSLGDSVLKIATPFGVADSIDEVLKVIKDEDIDEIILGFPIKMSSSVENFHEDFLSFRKKLEEKTSLNIIVIDERLSSKAADALVGNKKTKAPRDAIAAMIILQSFLDSK